MENKHNILKAQLELRILKEDVGKPSLWQQYMFYRIQKLILNIIKIQDEKVNLMKTLRFEHNIKKFKETLIESTHLHFKFWSCLAEERPNYTIFIGICENLYAIINLTKKIWSKLQNSRKYLPKIYVLFSEYKLEIENDEKGSLELINL